MKMLPRGKHVFPDARKTTTTTTDVCRSLTNEIRLYFIFLDPSGVFIAFADKRNRDEVHPVI